MNNRRSILMLLLAVLGLAGAHLALDMSGWRRNLTVRRSRIGEIADEATMITLDRGDGSHLVLASLGTWRFFEPFDALADDAEVRKLLDALAFSPVEDSISELEMLRLGRQRSDFGLENPVLRLSLASGDRKVSIAFGSAVPSGCGVYAEVDGDGSICVVSTDVFAAVSLPLDRLRSHRVFTLNKADVAAIDFKSGVGEFSRFRCNNGEWAMVEPEVRRASAQKINEFLEAMMESRIRSFAWPVGPTNELGSLSSSLLAGYGLDSESCVTIVVRSERGDEDCVAFGKDAGEGLVYSLVHGGGVVAEIDARFKALMESRSGFTDGRIFQIERSKISSVSMIDGDVAYLLSRGKNGNWWLETPVSAPADDEMVSSLLSRITALNTGDIDENGIAVSVATNLPAVKVSRQALLGGARIDDLRSKDMLKLDLLQVRRLSLPSAGGDGNAISVVFDQDRRSWAVEKSAQGRVADETAIAAILASLNPLKAIEIVKLKVAASSLGEYGLEKPQFALAIDRLATESVRRNILIGDRCDNGYYATIGASEAVFVLDAKAVEVLMTPFVK